MRNEKKLKNCRRQPQFSLDKDNDLVFHFKFSKIIRIMAITLKRPIYAWENRDVTSGTLVEIADFSDGAPLEFIQWLYPASTSIYILYLHRAKPASSLEKVDQQMHKDPAIRYPGSGDSTNAVQRRSNVHHGNFKLKRSRVDYDKSLLRHLNIVIIC